MHTWILNQPGQFTAVQPAHPHNPAPGEALVKVHRMGICGTDYHAYRGEQPYFAYPRLLGHELGVEVLAIGQGVSEVRVGDRCAVRPYLACGQCDACLRGYPNACEQIKVLGVHTDGGLQLFLTLPAPQLHRSGKLSFEDLALVEPLSIGAHAVNRAKIKAEDRVLILGAGPIGLAVATFAGFHQPQQLVVADVQAQRLRLLSQLSFPQTPQPLPLAQHPLEEILSSFGGKNPTVIFDATGHPQSMEHCFSYAAHGGTIVYVGLCRQTLCFSDPLFHQKELSLLASRNSQPADFDQIIHLMENGHLHTKAWITHRYPLSQLPQAFETISSSGGDICLKAMIATDA